MQQINTVNPLLSRDQAAKYLGVKVSTLAVWACTKRYNLTFIRVGRLCKYRLTDLDAFIARNIVGCDVAL